MTLLKFSSSSGLMMTSFLVYEQSGTGMISKACCRTIAVQNLSQDVVSKELHEHVAGLSLPFTRMKTDCDSSNQYKNAVSKKPRCGVHVAGAGLPKGLTHSRGRPRRLPGPEEPAGQEDHSWLVALLCLCIYTYNWSVEHGCITRVF